MRIIYKNLALQATVSLDYGTENSLYPLSNLVNGRLHPESRITHFDQSILIKYYFEQALTINGVLVASANIPKDVNYQIRSYTNSDPTAPPASLHIDTTWADIKNHSHFFTETSHQYWWLYWYSLGAAGAEHILPEIWLVNNLELPHNCTLSSAVDKKTGEVFEMKTGGGNIWGTLQWKGRSLNLTWENLTEAELQSFNDLHETCFPNGTFWLDFGIDSTSPDVLFCYYRNKSLDITPQGAGLYSVNIEIQEVPEPNYYA